jgi:hypothetical protein
MAVGSNTLGLLFKIGVDASDAEKQVTGLGKVVSDLGNAFKEGFGAGAAKGAKDIETATTGVGNAFKQLITPVNQSVQGFRDIASGNFSGGFTQLARSLGPVGLAIGAAAVAAYGAVKAFEQLADVSEKIGTTSKDDFEEFQKALEAVGVTLTKTDQIIAQQLNKSFADLKATTDSLFLILLRTTGPALVVLINEISHLLVGLGPALDIIGRFISANLIQAAAVLEVIGKFIKALKEDASGAFFNFDFVKEFLGALDKVRAATTAVAQSPLIPFEPGKVRAVTAEVNDLTKAIAAAQKELDKLRQTTADIIIQNMEDQLKGLNQAILDVTDIKKIAAIKFGLVDFANLVTKEIDGMVQDIARLGQAIPGDGKGIPGLPDPKDIQDQLDAIHQTTKKGFLEDLGSTLEQSGLQFKGWGDLVGGVLGQVAGATEKLLENFILTGKGGAAAFKALAAAIIASLAVQAGVEAIMEVARGIKELALAAADAASFNFYGAALHTAAAHAHFGSAAVFGIIAGGAAAVGIGIGASGGLGGGTAGAAAGAGGFGGNSTQAPGTLTINQGAPGTLGITLLSSIDNHLSNITTAPPGDILQRGAEQNPMAVGQANNEAARRDGTVSREFLQISGLRTA